MSQKRGERMEEDVSTSVAIQPLEVYPLNCEAEYGPELCKQLKQMQELANSLNTNIGSLVQDYEEAVQEYDRVFEKLQLAKATGTTTSATLKKLENDKTVLENEKNRLQNRLNLLQQRTLPKMTDYMGQVNKAVSGKRKISQVTKTELSPTQLFAIMVGTAMQDQRTQADKTSFVEQFMKFKDGFYRAQNQQPKLKDDYVKDIQEIYNQNKGNVSQDLQNALRGKVRDILNQPRFNEEVNRQLRIIGEEFRK